MGWNLFQREQGRIETSRWSKPAPPQQGGSSGCSLLLLHHQSMPTARGIRQPDPGSPFWCKPTCTSKCLWPSVRHRQRFPIAPISLTPIYFKILHRRKKKNTPTQHQLFCRASCEAHQGEERLVLTPWIQLCCHTEPIYSSGDSAVTDAGKSYRTHIPVPLHIPAPARLRGGSGRARKSTELAEHSHTATLSVGTVQHVSKKSFPSFSPPFPPSLHRGSKWRAPWRNWENAVI